MHMFLSNEGPTLETLDFTFRIVSAQTFLYFNLYFNLLFRIFMFQPYLRSTPRLFNYDVCRLYMFMMQCDVA